jgi:hypothetical protein
MRPIRALMLVAAPLVLTACAAFNRTSASAPPRIVEVQNAHDSDVAVYLRRGNYEHPLGIVRANGRTTLVIARHLLRPNGSMQLIGDPKVGLPFEMRPFRLVGEQYAKWEITPDPRHSQLTVWSAAGTSGDRRIATSSH